ncbi:hypothetical protein DEO72_LG10g454 [Vigna unguiculata]|uniref:Uncharacterized protein n=1 Tax=Vigna unguiculata TaxID=3917 RepID=A0A4D6NAV4_VIGUN|nr:hypothetical protein DEO72_LG10g454 [Vigna unguiculata]
MGVSSIVEVSRRSLRETKTELLKSKKKLKFWSWCLCLGWRSTNCEGENAPSLAQFLAVERRVANENRRNQSLHFELALAETNIAERNSLFINGTIAPPHSISPTHSIGTDRKNTEIKHANNKASGSLPQIPSLPPKVNRSDHMEREEGRVVAWMPRSKRTTETCMVDS